MLLELADFYEVIFKVPTRCKVFVLMIPTLVLGLLIYILSIFMWLLIIVYVSAMDFMTHFTKKGQVMEEGGQK